AQNNGLQALTIEAALNVGPVFKGGHRAHRASRPKLPCVTNNGIERSALRLAKIGAKNQLLIVTVRALQFEIVMQTTIAKLIGPAANRNARLQRGCGAVAIRD